MEFTNIPARIREVSRLSGDFLLPSGEHTATYLDTYRFQAEPILLRKIAEAMVLLLPTGIEVLGGLRMSDVPIVTMLSQLGGLPAACICDEANDGGRARCAEGAQFSGRRVALVQDLVSSGGTILNAVSKLRSKNVSLDVALCVIDRESGAKETLAGAGIDLKSLFTFAQIEDAK